MEDQSFTSLSTAIPGVKGVSGASRTEKLAHLKPSRNFVLLITKALEGASSFARYDVSRLAWISFCVVDARLLLFQELLLYFGRGLRRNLVFE